MKNYYTSRKWYFFVWLYLNFLGGARRLKKSQKLEAEETCKVTLSQIAPTMYFLIACPIQLLTAKLQSPVQKLDYK